MENKLQILRPFGPPVIKATIPKELVDTLNNYTDETIKQKEKALILDAGKDLAGNVTQEFKIDEDFARKSGWINFLSTIAAKSIEALKNKKITKFNLTSTWVVRQYQYEYNPLHSHSGHLSGVGYLKVPSTLGKTIQNKPERRNKNGQLTLVHGSKQFLNESIFGVTPKIGDFYIFPSYLLHSVNPFYESSEERRSISFNAIIDEGIFGDIS